MHYLSANKTAVCMVETELTRPVPSPAEGSAGSGMSMDIHRDLSSVEAVWREFETSAGTSPHQSFDWCRSWVAATGGDVLVVDIRRNGKTVCLLPLEVSRVAGARIARFIAAPFSNINFGLFPAGDGGGPLLSPALLRTAIAEKAPEVDIAVFGRMPLRWRGRLNPLAGLASVPSHNHAFQVTLDGGFDAVLERINGKKRRKKFRATARQLEAVGGYRFVTPGPGAEALELLETFFVQKERRFARQGKLNIFAAEPVRDFFRQLVLQPDRNGVAPLRLSALRFGNGRTGAIAGQTVANGHVICQFCSLDETAAEQFSVGEFLFFHMIRKACDEGQTIFDFGIGDERYKRSWCDVETVQYDFYLPLTMRGNIACGVLKGTVAAKRRIKADPRLERLARGMQRLLHRQ